MPDSAATCNEPQRKSDKPSKNTSRKSEQPMKRDTERKRERGVTETAAFGLERIQMSRF